MPRILVIDHEQLLRSTSVMILPASLQIANSIRKDLIVGLCRAFSQTSQVTQPVEFIGTRHLSPTFVSSTVRIPAFQSISLHVS